MHKGVERFVADLTATAKKHGIRVKLTKGKTVHASPSIRCGGFFDGNTLSLVVATGRRPEEWLRVLVHESCHMDQYIADSKYWREATDNHYMKFHRFLDGRKVRNIETAVDAMVKLEADCERRAVRKIKKYRLPVDVTKYIQHANGYLYSHKAIVQHQSWYKLLSNKYCPVTAQMPKKLLPPAAYTMARNKMDMDIFDPWFK